MTKKQPYALLIIRPPLSPQGELKEVPAAEPGLGNRTA
jgi:hypothetical protein